MTTTQHIALILLTSALSVLVALYLWHDKTGEVIEIHTETVSVLTPHEHTISDTILDPSHHHTIKTEVLYIPEDTWVTGMELKLHNAPASVLHHAVLYDVNSPNDECGSESYKLLANVGEDIIHTPSVHFPEPYGVYLPKGSLILGAVMLHNPLPPAGVGGTYEDVSVSFVLHAEESSKTDRSEALEYYFMTLEDVPCTGTTFTVPSSTQQYVERAPTDGFTLARMTVPSDGTILYSGAHLHGWEGGRELNMYRNSELLETFKTKPSERTPYIWSTEHGFTDIPLQRNDVLEIEAVYSNPHPEPIRGAMGIYGFFFAPKSN